MPQKYVFCHATSRTQASHIVDRLKAAQFTSNDISALFDDHHTRRNTARGHRTRASTGILAGTGFGGLIGGALGWTVGMGAWGIPYFAPLVAAGPMLAALSSALVAAIICGIVGGVIGMGVPSREALQEKSKLQDGNILISVQTETPAEITRAEVIFAYAGAQDICTTADPEVASDNQATEIITYPIGSGLRTPSR
jgi:hypothetical protein